MARKPAWSLTEQAAAVSLYFRMRAEVDAGRPYNKAAMIRKARFSDADHGTMECRAELWMRSKQSIEAKLMNVTAVLHDLGRHDVSMAEHGYRPLSNYQAELRTTVVGLLAVRDEAVAGGFEVPSSA